MDDPPSARANNTELIRDVLAIMFHGDAFRACLLYYGQSKNSTFCPIFFFQTTGCRCPASAHWCASVIAWRSSDRTQGIPKSVIVSWTTKREIKLGVEENSATSGWNIVRRVAMINGRLWQLGSCVYFAVGDRRNFTNVLWRIMLSRRSKCTRTRVIVSLENFIHLMIHVIFAKIVLLR